MKDYEIIVQSGYGDDMILAEIYVRADLLHRMEHILHLLGLPCTFQPETSMFTIRKTILWEENEIDHIKSFIVEAWEKMAEKEK